MVWSPQGDQSKDQGEWLQTCCNAFADEHPEWDITFVYGVADEASAAGQVSRIRKHVYTGGDQSILILLYGVATVFLTVLMLLAWRGALRSAYKAECLAKAKKHVNNFREDLKSLLHKNLHRLLMTPPVFFIFAFTVLPLIFMICMAFTNYSKIGSHLMLFDWVGLDNFKALFDSSSILGSTFWSVLGWTLIWAFFATFSNLYIRE